MALDKPGFKETIKTLLSDMRERVDNSDDEFADRLTTAIDDYIKSATIIYTAGLTSPQGPVTGAFEGNLQ